MYVLKSNRKTYHYENHGDALSVLLLAKKNGANISLVSETHYFDSEIGDILLIANNEKLTNENDNGNTREVLKSKTRRKV
jgi:hypothetical protein